MIGTRYEQIVPGTGTEITEPSTFSVPVSTFGDFRYWYRYRFGNEWYRAHP
ncbi:hypothetical protein HanXRQr2_Chr04g0168561 [Helianthus annuus]|uniref:Uncharacterized protein n=1 Tax=Helianthus annuus TaxID=4232 RepID=A0A9K3J7Q9_HELAN|nr:hypothetical protein HanXRQr2_Chr04g0168561 [Helianthus annuus]